MSTGIPTGTLTINLLGCLGGGLLGGLSASSSGMPEEWRLLLMAGLLGWFTTFSALGLETVALALEGAVGKAALYIFLSNVLGVAATFIGHRLARGS